MSVENGTFTRRDFLRLSALTAAGAVAREAAKVFPDIPSFVLAEGPQNILDLQIAQTFKNGSLDQGAYDKFFNEHSGVLSENTNLPPENLKYFYAVGSIRDVLSHVQGRNERAVTEYIKTGHCPDTAYAFLTQTLSQIASGDRIPDGFKVFLQNELGKNAIPVQGGEILKLVYYMSGVNGNGADFKAIVSYLNLRTGQGTVYTVSNLDRIGTKGTPITNPQVIEQKLKIAGQKFGDDCDKKNPTPKSETAPVSAPANAQAVEESNGNPDLVKLLIAAGILVTGGAAVTRRGGQGKPATI